MNNTQDNFTMSYLTMRNFIGFLGLGLPWLLCLFPIRPNLDYLWGLEPSISDYFYTNRGDFLVVTLTVLGVFLLTYKGLTKGERRLTSIAAICAMGVAFFPTQPICNTCEKSIHTTNGGVFGNLGGEPLHIAFAGIFLTCLAIMSLHYFTMGGPTKNGNKLTQKGKRNRVYVLSGWVMIFCVVILIIYFLLKDFMHVNFGRFPVVFTFETIAVEFFGLSWITKGETLWPDGQHYIIKTIQNLKKT